MIFQVAQILELLLSVEPFDSADMGATLRGLKLLNRVDPFMEVTISARGEHVLAVTGEVHPERCIKDLKERFVKVGLEV
jgi:ribosome assembly protein 1